MCKRNNNAAEYERYGRKCARDARELVARSVASSLRSVFYRGEPISEDVHVLRELSRHNGQSVRKVTLEAHGGLGRKPAYSWEAANLALSVKIGDSEELAAELCDTLKACGLDLLDDELSSKFFGKLVEVPELYSMRHGISQLVSSVVAIHPLEGLHFMLARIDHYHANLEEWTLELSYHPVPYKFSADFSVLKKHAEQPELLEALLSRLCRDSMARTWLIETFWQLARVDDQTVRVIDKRLGSNSEATRAMMFLVSEGPESLRTERAAFISRVKQACASAGSELAKEAQVVLCL